MLHNYSCFVFDLDDTLIRATSRPKYNAVEVEYKSMIGEKEKIWINKRPGFEKILEKCFEIGTVGVWSMGQPGYVESVVKLFPKKPDFIYNWTNCDRDGSHIYKNLDMIPNNGKILMIDDSPHKLAFSNPNIHVLPIARWRKFSPEDQHLFDILNE